MRRIALLLALVEGPTAGCAAAPPRETGLGFLPLRVHAFEDYETEIEKRWWMRGIPEGDIVPPTGSASVANLRACRAAETKDFDDKMGDPTKKYRAVVFNPVPAPPMGPNTRLRFRFWLRGTQTLRVQIYSRNHNYHRRLDLTDLPRGTWQTMTVNMTHLRRPDGSGGPLSADERVLDLQFYIRPDAELIIDDIVLYEPAPADETRPFPRRLIFAGGFDTGRFGGAWSGDFDIVPHEPPLTWRCARSVIDPATGESRIRVSLRGERRVSSETRLRFRYRLTGADTITVRLAHAKLGRTWTSHLTGLSTGAWSEATADFHSGGITNEIRFIAPKGAELLVDDILLYEP